MTRRKKLPLNVRIKNYFTDLLKRRKILEFAKSDPNNKPICDQVYYEGVIYMVSTKDSYVRRSEIQPPFEVETDEKGRLVL